MIYELRFRNFIVFFYFPAILKHRKIEKREIPNMFIGGQKWKK